MSKNTIISLGCRLNAAESEAMRRMSDRAGLDGAVIVNSCAVTNEAVRSTRQQIRRARRDNPDAPVIVTGCAAQIDPQSFADMPEVTSVIGNDEKLDPKTWQRIGDEGGPQMLVNDIMSVRDTAAHMADGYGEHARAFLQIQNGCDHRCTFCIIPFGRGNARSVPVEMIVDQARRLVANGHDELVLTGVDITSWGTDLEGTPKLGSALKQLLHDVPELARVRLSSIDGAEIDDALFDLFVSEPRIAPYAHLSVQSGDDMILKRMKRRHDRSQIIELCRALRAKRPEMSFGADIIVGFPTETDDMFEQSLKLVDEAGLQFLHVFPFSPREGTPAARMPQVNGKTIRARAERLRQTGADALAKFLDTQIGTTQSAVSRERRARAAWQFCGGQSGCARARRDRQAGQCAH